MLDVDLDRDAWIGGTIFAIILFLSAVAFVVWINMSGAAYGSQCKLAGYENGALVECIERLKAGGYIHGE